MLNETNDDASLASSQTAGSAQGRWILNEEEYDNYFKTSDVRKTTMPNGWNKNIYCKICPANKDKAHYMRVAVRKCSSNLCNSAQVETRCPVNYRIEHCELAGYCITKRGNEHQALLENLSLADRPYGMAEYYKDRVRGFMASGITTSKQIEITLIGNREQYDARFEWPTAVQIQNFVREAKRTNPEQNVELGPVIAYLAAHEFTSDIAAATPFHFGSVVATGTDMNHLFIFVTCKHLLANLQLHGSSSVNHLDGTYKITDREFPLLVFGLSDLSGHFFPVAFAVVSHESAFDFGRFFDTLLTLCQLLSIAYNPPFLMMDASVATFNAAHGMYTCTI